VEQSPSSEAGSLSTAQDVTPFLW